MDALHKRNIQQGRFFSGKKNSQNQNEYIDSSTKEQRKIQKDLSSTIYKQDVFQNHTLPHTKIFVSSFLKKLVLILFSVISSFLFSGFLYSRASIVVYPTLHEQEITTNINLSTIPSNTLPYVVLVDSLLHHMKSDYMLYPLFLYAGNIYNKHLYIHKESLLRELESTHNVKKVNFMISDIIVDSIEVLEVDEKNILFTNLTLRIIYTSIIDKDKILQCQKLPLFFDIDKLKNCLKQSGDYSRILVKVNPFFAIHMPIARAISIFEVEQD